MKTITVNGIEYVPKSIKLSEKAKTYKGLEYKIVRTYSAGVFAGYLESKKGKEVILRSARRLWYWDGAASLSQLAMEGVTKPENCKFPCEVDKIVLTEAIEIIDCSEEARQSIAGVLVWEQ